MSPPEKKWFEYPRPIPCDDHHRRTTQQRYFDENKCRRLWKKKYGDTVPLYWQDGPIVTELCQANVIGSSVSDGATPMAAFAPTAHVPDYEEYRPQNEEKDGIKIKDDGSDNLPEFNSSTGDSPPKPKFRVLSFPPKCNHVCARMGFNCWMGCSQ